MSHKLTPILLVAGTRPNFVKIAALLREFKKVPGMKPLLVHTGQHYDYKMSQIFFRDLHIARPDIFLDVAPSTDTEQTARIMVTFESALRSTKADLVVVVGDVNSTLACSLVAAKKGVRVAHVEAGLRSFDRSMPEEINRILVDSISSFLFVSEPSGLVNLRHEGIGQDAIYYTGNVMIDTLKQHMKTLEKSKIIESLGLKTRAFGVMTLHRPSNVDSKESLQKILVILKSVCRRTKLVYPVHPRSRKMMKRYGLDKEFRSLAGLHVTSPLGYIDFMKLVKQSSFVLTDSGGIQEETTYLRVPCLTMRENTERPVTISMGTNELVGTDQAQILKNIDKILCGKWRKSKRPRFWDGHAARRIVRILRQKLTNSA